MTIAVGFRCTDGVLIASDREVSDGITKSEERKLFSLTDSGQYAAFASGAGLFHPIKDIALHLRSENFFDGHCTSLANMASAVRLYVGSKYYRQKLKEVNAQAYNLELLFAFRDTSNRTGLFYVHNADVSEVDEYIAIGTGSPVARYLTKWLCNNSVMPIKLFTPMLIRILRECKGHSYGVGGPSDIVKLYEGDKPASEPDFEFGNDVESFWGIYERLAPIIRGCIDTGTPDAVFDTWLSTFETHVRGVRAAAKNNEAIRKAGLMKAAQQRLRLTTADQTLQPPSPESPEGSGES
jgi:20S proteasome alpha/beta subunit